MAYVKSFFNFLMGTVTPIHNTKIAENFNAVTQIIKRIEQFKVFMQIAWFKIKLFD